MTAKALQLLLVEDNPAHAELIRRAFVSSDRPVSLTVARSLQEARATLATTQPDLAIIDLLLPDGRGLELLPGDARAACYPSVMMTSYGNEQAAVEAIKTGAVDYVVKSDATLADMPHIAERRCAPGGTSPSANGSAQPGRPKDGSHWHPGWWHCARFNNILTAILGCTISPWTTSPGGHRLELSPRGRKAGLRAKTLVQQILTFSRRTEQLRTPVPLPLLIKEVLALLRASIPSTIEIRQEITQDVGTVLGDPTQLQQVLLNLCTNAAHAMHVTGGRLEVRLEAVVVDAPMITQHPELQPGPSVCITVTDTGHGIPPEVLERIFEPFFTTKGPGEGTGMGLALVHGIITDHGGAVLVDSAVGQGTTFTIYLPRSAEPAQNEASRMRLLGLACSLDRVCSSWMTKPSW